MISSKTPQAIEGFDELINKQDEDFDASGLKLESVLRISRLAVVNETILTGSIGNIARERLQAIKTKLAAWLSE